MLTAKDTEIESLSRQVKIAVEALTLIADQTLVDVSLHHELITRAAKETLSEIAAEKEAK